MKIAISGSHGIGKTTLINALADRLKVPVINEIAREVAKEMEIDHCDIIKDSDMDTIRLFQSNIFYWQLLVEQEMTDFVSDRSIFDSVAYMEYYGLPADLVDDFLQYAIRHSANYDAIIYCPIPKGAKLEADGFRLVEGQMEYDSILKRLLFRAECRVAKLTSDRERWLDKVLSIMPA